MPSYDESGSENESAAFLESTSTIKGGGKRGSLKGVLMRPYEWYPRIALHMPQDG
jgi:hypothetical protein